MLSDLHHFRLGCPLALAAQAIRSEPKENRVSEVRKDGDALTRQPGDVTGNARLKIPADRVVVTLDTLL